MSEFPLSSTEQGETAIIGIPTMFWKLSKDGKTIVRADRRTTDDRWVLRDTRRPVADFIRELETDTQPTVATEELAVEWITSAAFVVMLGG